MNYAIEVKSLRNDMGMNRMEFCEYFQIPYRTVVDVNPVPYGDELSLLVDDKYNSISIKLAIQTAPRFGISEKEASVLCKGNAYDSQRELGDNS